MHRRWTIRARLIALVLGLRAALLLAGCTPGHAHPTVPDDPASAPVIFPGHSGPMVLIKADDLSYYWRNASALHPRWVAFIDLVRAEDAKAALGLEGWSLASGKDGYFQALRDLVEDGRFELFNHGYTHSLEGADSSWHATAEFQGTPYAFQKTHLAETQKLLQQKVGVTCVAFGAPGNAADAATVQALSETPEIRLWFLGRDGAGKRLVSSFSPCERPLGRPNYDAFISGYRQGTRFFVLQIHPGSWLAAEDFGNFRRILEFLKDHGATFVTPAEYLKATKEEDSRPAAEEGSNPGPGHDHALTPSNDTSRRNAAALSGGTLLM